MKRKQDQRFYDEVQIAFNKRYQRKKKTNLAISLAIVILGVSSFMFGLRLESFPTIFRWMTVDGTVFTTLGASLFVVVNLVEMLAHTEMTRVAVYYIRLSSAVAESVVFIVVMFSRLPFFAEHLPIFDRYDSFVMHVLIPILGVVSFMINDSPIGRLSTAKRWHGTWFVTFYAVVILTLIGTGQLSSEMIPYFFLDYRQNGWGVFLCAFAFVYGSAYLMAWRLSEWNRKLSWIWFKGIAGGGPNQRDV